MIVNKAFLDHIRKSCQAKIIANPKITVGELIRANPFDRDGDYICSLWKEFAQNAILINNILTRKR